MYTVELHLKFIHFQLFTRIRDVVVVVVNGVNKCIHIIYSLGINTQ